MSIVKDGLILVCVTHVGINSYIPTCVTHTHVLRIAEHKTQNKCRKRCPYKLVIYTVQEITTLHYDAPAPCITKCAFRACHNHQAGCSSHWPFRPKDPEARLILKRLP